MVEQGRMQRCAQMCQDEAKDMVPEGAKEGDASIERAMAKVWRIFVLYFLFFFFFFTVCAITQHIRLCAEGTQQKIFVVLK